MNTNKNEKEVKREWQKPTLSKLEELELEGKSAWPSELDPSNAPS